MQPKLITLSEAIEAMRKGATVKRQCWASSTLHYVPAYRDNMERIDVKLYTGQYASWCPTIDDVLGNDWMIV